MHKVVRTTTLSAFAMLAVLAGSCHAQTNGFHGVNWADPRDNYATDALILSGTSSGDSYSSRKATAQRVAQQFKSVISGVNTVRIPINPATASSATWSVYRGVIDGLRAEGMNVIIGYWEGPSKDGRIDNQSSFNTMWDTVVSAYQSDSGVLFEPMNEPYGYSLADWSSTAASWIARYSSLARNRIVVDGQGYSEDVNGVCADSRLSGTRLGLHVYAYWKNQNYDQWVNEWKTRIGSCASRTITTEFGATMNSGLNYGASSSNNEVMYFQAGTSVMRSMGMGSVYWPGLRDGDSYSLTTRSGSGSSLTLSIVNASARDNVRYGWGY